MRGAKLRHFAGGSAVGENGRMARSVFDQKENDGKKQP